MEYISHNLNNKDFLANKNFGDLKKVKAKSFWKRQFQSETTKAQKSFDVIFGIILPALCFLFDPLIFRSSHAFGETEFGAYKPFVYLFSYVSIMGLLAFKLWGARLKWLNGFLCGLFTVAAFASFGIGLVLFPISLLGLIILIGALGFTPLLTSFVYLRNAVRAYQVAALTIDKKLFFNSAVLGAVLSVSLTVLVNRKIETGLQTMKNSDAQTVRSTARRLKMVAPLIDVNRLNGANCEGKTSAKHDALVEAYEELSGNKLNNYDYLLCKNF